MAEMATLKEILLQCSKGASRLFRNNSALAWGGQVQKIAKRGMIHVEPGDVVVRDAHPIHCGLCNGSSDLIGWRTVHVTPAHVGQRLAQFVAVEVKSDIGRTTEAQRIFIANVERAGGLAGVARSVADAQFLLADGRIESR